MPSLKLLRMGKFDAFTCSRVVLENRSASCD